MKNDGLGKIIIAGGKSTRFGEDKLSYQLGGRAILERVVSGLSFIDSDSIIVTSEERGKIGEGLGRCKTVFDFIPQGGPLASIYTGLTFTEHEYSFVCAGDMPFVSRDVISYMAGEIKDNDIVIPEIGDGMQTLHAIYSRKCYPILNRALQMGSGRMRYFFSHLKVRRVSEDELRGVDPELKSLFDIDSQNDLKLANQILDGEHK